MSIKEEITDLWEAIENMWVALDEIKDHLKDEMDDPTLKLVETSLDQIATILKEG